MGPGWYKKRISATGEYSNEYSLVNKNNAYTRDQPAKRRPLLIILAILALVALAHFIAVRYLQPPQEQTQPLSCATYLHRLDYTKLIALQTGQSMAAVQFIENSVAGQPAVLLQVNENDPQQKVDTYIYGCFMHQNTPELHLLFKQLGLIQGAIGITAAHTLSIAQSDTTLSTSNNDTLLIPQQQYVYQEYTWQHGAFQQVTFPSLYPVTSRSEAEALQAEADHGPMIPWDDPLATAEQMAQDLFHWNTSEIQSTVKDNNNIDAHVLLTRKDSHLQVIVSLSRLIRHDSHGLWFVTDAQTPGITLDQSRFSTTQSSPLTIQGTINPTTSPIKVELFDHTLSPIRIMNSDTLYADNEGTFTGHIAYTGIFPGQTGLLLIESQPDPQNNEPARLYLTNLLLN